MFDQGETIRKVPVCGQDRAQQVFYKGHRIVATLVLAVLGSAKGLIVQVLVFGDLGLQRNVSAYIESAAIKEQRGQQTAHATIPIIERVDAQEIMDEHRNGDQRLQLQIPDHAIVFRADLIQRRRCFEGREGREQDLHMTVRVGGADIVLHVLGLPGQGVVGVAVQDLVELEDVIAGDGDGVEALVDDGKRVPIPGDLLLAAVPGRGLLRHQLTDAGVRGHDALDGIGGLGALDLSDLHQLFQLLQPLLQVQFLLSGLLVDGRHQAQDLRIPFLLPVFAVIERSHARISSFIPLYLIRI